MSIFQLPPNLVNQIAAGEVLARPASAVKELLENSLDANSSLIELTVLRGGLELIRLRDNGCGISSSDLPLALAPHATSKLQSFEELSALQTFGFRGEALASLAAVSDLVITSKTGSASCAYTIAHHNGSTTAPLPAAHPDGTTIEARELFAQLPARRKFLRSPRTEWSSILSICETLALTHPEVELLIKNDQRLALHCAPIALNSSKEERFFTRLRQLFKFEPEQSAYVSNEKAQSIDNIEIFGWVFADLVPQRRIFFVNNRPIKNSMLQQAVRTAILETRQETTFSVLSEDYSFVFFLNLSPKEVDINVHPAKEEVRFRAPAKVHHALFSAIRCALICALAPLTRNRVVKEKTVVASQPICKTSLFEEAEAVPNRSAIEFNFYPKGEEESPKVKTSHEDRVLLAADALALENKEATLSLEPNNGSTALPSLASLELGRFLGSYKNQFLIFRQREMFHAYKADALFKSMLEKQLAHCSMKELREPCLVQLPPKIFPNLERELLRLGFECGLYSPELLLRQVPEALQNLKWSEHGSAFLSASFSQSNGSFLGWSQALQALIPFLLPSEDAAHAEWIKAIRLLPFSEEELLAIYRQRSSFSLEVWLNS